MLFNIYSIESIVYQWSPRHLRKLSVKKDKTVKKVFICENSILLNGTTLSYNNSIREKPCKCAICLKTIDLLFKMNKL